MKGNFQQFGNMDTWDGLQLALEDDAEILGLTTLARGGIVNGLDQVDSLYSINKKLIVLLEEIID
ncbi:MAG: hypothetical protein GY816_13690 [Cytophagales bacterium]|nr:hypothetical protein [Cytophagales bacterium]